MTSARRLWAQTVLTIVVIGIILLVCLWLVPALGLRGAAIALVIAASFRTIGSAAVLIQTTRRMRQDAVPAGAADLCG
jgi:Na+-driven multidrug efflux pump